MNLYKAELRLTSAIGTELAADTMFGHICWSIYYEKGEHALKTFLAEMDSQKPPLILSDPFSSGFLPVPVLPIMTESQREHLKTTIGQDHYKTIKDLSKARLMSLKQFSQCKDDLSSKMVLCQLLKENKDDALKMKRYSAPHNHVNRLGGGTIQGGIYFTEDTFIDSQGICFDMYVLSEKFNEKEIEEILKAALKGGYGRDKSTGKGVIKVESVKSVNLPAADKPNAVMLLGGCVPKPDNPTNGFWNIKAKSGRLGGHWAITKRYWKKTVMMLQSGSILLTDLPRQFYGSMVHNVHPDIPEVDHYGLAVALPVRVNIEEKAEAV